VPTQGDDDLIAVGYIDYGREVESALHLIPNLGEKIDIASICGGIPESRVVYLKFCDEVIWHRERRIDLVLGSGITSGTIRNTMDQYAGEKVLSCLVRLSAGEQRERLKLAESGQECAALEEAIAGNLDEATNRIRVNTGAKAIDLLLHDDQLQGAQMIILVGVPGSGKSTFASQLAREGARIQSFNQDVIGSQEKMAKQVSRALSQRFRVVRDIFLRRNRVT
jgi:replication-associated recombination protein RarA